MYSIDFNETSLVEREIPSVMDVNRLIAEIHKRPALWDIRNGEHKARYCVPNLWKDVARCVGVNVTVEQCKRKWKNLRDAYRAEVRRAERRMERDKLMGEYEPNTNYTSKWVYFHPMSFINDSKRPRYTIEYENTNSYDNDHENENEHDTHLYNACDIKLESPHNVHEGTKYDFHTLEDDKGESCDDDDDDEAANDMLFAQFENIATPQAARRLSATISLGNSLEHNLQHRDLPDITQTSTKSQDCNCSESTDDQVHFLEDLEKEEQKLIVSTRKDITRSSKLDHVGDSDYNFLVSFLPQMKKMTELENLQFRSKMCEMVLNILGPSISTNPSPVPLSSLPFESRNATPTIQQPESSDDNIKETDYDNFKETDKFKDAENANDTATSTTSHYFFEREIPNAMDINRLIAEIHKRPRLWDIRNGEHKSRNNVPDLWNEVARSVGSDVEQCKRKWKNLRDAYRAEVRRAERRIERDRLTGEYDPNANYSSKWVYFVPMSFINDTKRNRYAMEYENTNSNSFDNDNDNDNEHEFYDEYDQHYQNMSDFKSEPEQLTQDGSNYGTHILGDRDNDTDEAANDRLFKEFQNIATPLTARRLSSTLSLVNTLEHKFQHKDHDPLDLKSAKLKDCNCAKRSDDQVHFLEHLEKEEQKLIVSTRKDITRSNKLDHVGDSDYNFLVSFLPQMKKMTQLENLQFRSKMCELVLNTLAPSISTKPSPASSPIMPLNPSNASSATTCQQTKSSGNNVQETEGNNTATSTTSNN